jgi:hypothetical protein
MRSRYAECMKRSLAGALLFTAGLAGCGGPAPPTRFSDISAQVFKISCEFSSCHSTAGKGGHLVLDTDAYANLVGVPAHNPQANSEGKLRVAPGDSANSFLYIKLTLPPGPGGLCPTTSEEPDAGYAGCMPQTSTKLDPGVIDGIKQWIDQGAPNN